MSKSGKQIPPPPAGLRLVDTHTHLYMADAYPGEEAAQAVSRAVDAGVEMMIFPGVNEQTLPAMERLHALFPAHTRLAAGVHPDDLKPDWKAQLARVRQRMKQGPYIAVGEVGIDLSRDRSRIEEQKDAFEVQIGWAIDDGGIPVIIHCREGLQQTLEVIRRFSPSELPPLLFHSFTGDESQAAAILREVPGAMFAFNGVATFKNAPEVRRAAQYVGAERILLETDSPYLAPAPRRGIRNESALLPYVASSLADTLQMTAEQLADITTKAAYRFFGIFQ